MILQNGRKYSNKGSGIAFYVYKIRYESDVYYKIKGAIKNRYNGIEYERKNYKISKSIPIDFCWEDVGSVLGY